MRNRKKEIKKVTEQLSDDNLSNQGTYEFMCGYRLNQVLDDKICIKLEDKESDLAQDYNEHLPLPYEAKETKKFIMKKPFLLFNNYSLLYTWPDKRLTEIRLSTPLFDVKILHEEFLIIKSYIMANYKMTTNPAVNKYFDNDLSKELLKLLGLTDYPEQYKCVLDDYTTLSLNAVKSNDFGMLYLHVENLKYDLERLGEPLEE